MKITLTHQSGPLLNSVTGNLFDGNLDGQKGHKHLVDIILQHCPLSQRRFISTPWKQSCQTKLNKPIIYVINIKNRVTKVRVWPAVHQRASGLKTLSQNHLCPAENHSCTDCRTVPSLRHRKHKISVNIQTQNCKKNTERYSRNTKQRSYSTGIHAPAQNVMFLSP